MAKAKGSAGRAGQRATLMLDIRGDIQPGLREEVLRTVPAGERANYMLHAIDEFKARDDVMLVARDTENRNKLVGVATFWRDPDNVIEEEVPLGSYIRVRNIGAVKGNGGTMLRHIMNRASRSGAGVYLTSSAGFRGFYEHMGFTRAIGDTYWWRPPNG